MFVCALYSAVIYQKNIQNMILLHTFLSWTAKLTTLPQHKADYLGSLYYLWRQSLAQGENVAEMFPEIRLNCPAKARKSIINIGCKLQIMPCHCFDSSQNQETSTSSKRGECCHLQILNYISFIFISVFDWQPTIQSVSAHWSGKQWIWIFLTVAPYFLLHPLKEFNSDLFYY